MPSTILGPQSITLPSDSQANRPSPVEGMMRYNTDTALAEIYTANGWTAVDAPPAITSMSGTINADSNSTITINGSNFKTGSIVYITGSGVGGVQRALSTTYVNAAQLTAATAAASVNYTGGSSFGIKVVNPSGLSGTLDPAGTIDRDPVWSTSAGSLGTFNGAASANITLSAPDPDSTTVTYAVTSGSLPSGLSLSTSGVITGTYPDTSSTSSFTVTATSNGYGAARSFSITTQKRLLTVNGTTYYNTGSTQTVTLSSAGTVYPITVHNAHNLTVTCVGAKGTNRSGAGVRTASGNGGSVTGTYSNIPAASNYYVVVGQQNNADATGGYPGGGGGGAGGGGAGGGFSGFWSGTSDPLNTGNRSTYYLIGAGGGSASDSDMTGGQGGYPAGGTAGTNGCNRAATGGDQSSGGLCGIDLAGSTESATNGSAFYGGTPGVCGVGGGAGGGGWYGGGGGVSHCGQCGGGGGGGSSYYNSTYIGSFSYTNGANSGSGSVTLAIG